MDQSEVKHLPKVDHTPAKLDEASLLMLKAADLLERKGLAQWTTCDADGRMCVRGALMAAAGVPKRMMAGDRHPAWYWMDAGHVERGADDRLSKSIGEDPAEWNNRSHRTIGEVVSKLRAVALGG